MKRKLFPIEILLWSIAFPGFGQILNRAYIRGGFFIILEFVINVKSNLNLNIMYSFQGKSGLAIDVTNYEWAMFYPCIYLFAIFESYVMAYERLGLPTPPYLTLPFVSAAYFSTIGVIYSSIPSPIAPTFIPIIGIGVGVGIGFALRALILRRLSK
ncbi:hypothetical protein [Guptibacillus algicola]|uniref:hypothetical protein n=1 Tax=Guptibacillus algicola TaxID=225844 RepID=UPI001CD37AAF|nr:hypothetical protein [Alkalihalobacillus algicola]MCA0989082.1 hypothetical protein [Alkalihalobacillus algicola]